MIPTWSAGSIWEAGFESYCYSFYLHIKCRRLREEMAEVMGVLFGFTREERCILRVSLAWFGGR